MAYYSQCNPQLDHLLDEIKKSMTNVNKICQKYIDFKLHPPANLSSRSSSKKNAAHINFNNYKNIDSSNQQQIQNIVSQNDEDFHHYLSFTNCQLKQNTNTNFLPSQKDLSTFKTQIKSTLLIPPPPKAPLSPYFTFYTQKKRLIQSQYPHLSVTEAFSTAAKVWKSLSQTQKAPYAQRFYEQKIKYEQELAEYIKKYPNYKQKLQVNTANTNNQANFNSHQKLQK